MRKTKSTSCRSHRVAASSSSSKDDMSLGSHQEEAPAPSIDLSLPTLFHIAEAGCLHSGINSPPSTRHNGRRTFQCKFVSVLVFFNYNIIYEQLINISLIYFIFRFTNIEAA
jgi:hypothetical protein